MTADSTKAGIIMNWLFPALFFWIMLACFEVVGSVG